MTTARPKLRLVPLLDFVHKATPKYTRPDHLAPVAALFERAAREPVLAVISAPPRHGKSELLKAYICWYLLQRPSARVILATYAQRFSDKRSRELRGLFKRVGGKVADDASSRKDWRTTEDPGGVWSTSVEGAVTGEGGDLIVVDDPHKGRAEVESALERKRVRDWFNDDLMTRCEPGASVLVTSTRWHPDDLAGSLIADGWESINLPAIDADGRALWPARYTVEKLRQREEEIGTHSFSALYMGNPLPRGGALFRDVQFYDAAPAQMKITIGLDLAYSTKSRSDWSVAVVVGEHAGTFYILDVLRLQVGTPQFLSALIALRDKHGGAPCAGWFGGSEQGVLEMFRAGGLHVHVRNAVADKFSRAQPVAAAWNAGRVLLPRAARWLDDLVSEVVSFTGVGDRHDDQVDALAGAFDHAGGVYASGGHPNAFIGRVQSFAGGWSQGDFMSPVARGLPLEGMPPPDTAARRPPTFDNPNAPRAIRIRPGRGGWTV